MTYPIHRYQSHDLMSHYEVSPVIVERLMTENLEGGKASLRNVIKAIFISRRSNPEICQAEDEFLSNGAIGKDPFINPL